MSSPVKSSISVSRIVTDLTLVGASFVFWTFMLRPFVPLTDPVWIWVGSAYTAICMSGVTWLAFHMFRTVYKHEQEKKRAAGR
jgi:carbonic anhydrase